MDVPAADLRLRRLLVAAMLTALALLGPLGAGAQAAADGNNVEAAHRVRAAKAPRPPANRPPSAAFTLFPAAPTVGETVAFRSGSTDDGRIVSERWDLDGDGAFDDATGAPAVAGLRVTDDRGASSVAFQTVRVLATVAGGVPAPALAAPVSTLARGPAALRLLTPFPIVRIVGAFVGSRVNITKLAVRAARGALVRVRCRGRSCPARRLSGRSTAYTRPVRFRRLERQLRSGTVIEIFVTKRGRIGKYTRFVVRSGAAPLRRDACARGGATRPSRCPGS